MPMQNPFNDPAFSMASLTLGINKIPNMYGRLQQLNLMPGSGVATRSIIVEEQNGVLNLLPTKRPGEPGTVGKQGRRTVRSFVIPHIPHDDVVLPEDAQGIRAFGSENQMETLAGVMAKRLAAMRNKHAITLEWLRMGALKGQILDADGSTLFDLYTEFGITAKSVDFVLGTATTDIKAKCLEVIRHIEDNLTGEVMSGVHCLCSAEWFDAFTGHAVVKDAYNRWNDGQALREDMRKNFQFAGITFEEYRGSATDSAGTTRRFIASGEAHFFPLGTQEVFRTFYAPADFNETVNTIGLEMYAKQEPRKFGRGTDLHTQSNPLPMCARPALLVKGTTSN